jgi:hypothetical protein
MNRKVLPVVLAAVFFLSPFLTFSPAHASTPLPSPASVLGFEPATSRTIADWKQISDYFEKLDKASDRVTLKKLGKTAEGRDLFCAVISDAKNIRSLDRIAELQRRLVDPRKTGDEKKRDEALRDGKAVVAITCSLHSNEIVASQMALKLAYELASGETPENRRILENVVILLFPSPNPDGVDIMAEWYRKTFGTKAEGTIPPRLYHRYAGHDNNRDWYMLTQPETQNIVRFWYREWFPHVVYDIHQQGAFGARFTLPPFYDPPNPNIAPIVLRRVASIGEQMAGDVTAAGFKGVVTRSLYDTWWHGGLRSSAYYHNAVGLLSEAASARLMTPIEVKREQLKQSARGLPDPLETSTTHPEAWTGGKWTSEDIARLELTACRSMLTYAANYRRDLLEMQYRLGREAVEKGGAEAPYGYVIPAEQANRTAAARLVNLLWAQGVEVQKTKSAVTIDGATYPAGSFIVPTAQPFRANVKALFEVQTYPDRSGADGKAEPPYDITGWTLPLTMGVTALEIKSPLGGMSSEPVAGLLPEAAEWVSQPTPLASAENPSARVGIYFSYATPEDAGWTAWLLDKTKTPYRIVRDGDLRGGNLKEKLDVIVIPEQSVGGLVDGLPAANYPEPFGGGIGLKGIEELKNFVNAGGKLVCPGRSSDFALEKLGLPARNILKGRGTAEFYCPGAVLSLDVEAAANGGNAGSVCGVFSNGAAFATDQPETMKVLARYAEGNPLRSGWLRGAPIIAGQPAMVEIGLGSGKVVLFGFRPQFRGQSHATFGIFLNQLRS